MSYNIKYLKVWLVGAGPMAIDYARVLNHIGITPVVIGRGTESAAKFEEATKIQVHLGGLKKYLDFHMPNAETYIIIATGTEVLMPTLLLFLKLKCKRILIEKPAAISIKELLANERKLRTIQDKVFVAYNRRFYSSVRKAMELIKEDGGLQSIHFEFTEWTNKIESLHKAPGVKENWFFSNSTHVVDLAFYLAGNPVKWAAFSKSGQLTWHEKSNFSGAGITENGVLFSYFSNWESAGSWGIELMTLKKRIYLKPLERIQIQNKGSGLIEEFEFDKEMDNQFKFGLFNQVKNFLGHCSDGTINLIQHARNTNLIYAKILGKDQH
jgi:predicted dehydrogenase